ncbi:MAG: amidohydrolase family protein [Demequina sp.]|uniref:amidohydrolase family protein n=1 Tax=Demequina sp. TaxID=2050685 RepID=UPI003A8B4372
MRHGNDTPALLRSATTATGDKVDVTLADGIVQAVVPAGTAAIPTDSAAVLDLDGHLLLTSMAEPHAHLDKAGSWDRIHPPMGDLRAAIVSWRAYADTMTEADVVDRARAQVLRNVRHGTTAIRTHVDLLRGPDPLLGIRALVAVRDELSDIVDIEIITLSPDDIPTDTIEAALDAGADGVGAAAHLAPEPLEELERIVGIAERRGCVLDMHTDESLHEVVTLDALAGLTRGWTTNVSAGHCVRLGTVPAHQRDALIATAKESRIGIIANPITNLYLQGWGDDVATPRGIAPARALLDAGARFAAGADNVRDPFNPLGRSDALETAMLLVVGAHLTAHEAYAAVSSGARDVMGLPAADVTPGAHADLVAIRADHLTQAVAEAPADRIVLRRGRVVARTSSTTDFPSLTAPAPLEVAR